MFRKISNSGLIAILHADNDGPLRLWDKKLREGKVKRVTETDMRGLVIDFSGKVPYSDYLGCPANAKAQLGIRYPYLVVTAKCGDGKFFAFDVQILDDTGTRRRFRLATGQVTFDVQPFYCKIPLVMEDGWNNVVVPLHHLTREIYGTKYVETIRMQLYPSCRLKKVYFADKDYSEDELPAEFQQNYSLFTEHMIKKRYEEAKRNFALAAKEQAAHFAHSKRSHSEHEQKPTRGEKYPVREVIPRVIPVSCGLKNPPRPTYSSL